MSITNPQAAPTDRAVKFAESMYDQIRDVLEHHRLSYMFEDEKGAMPLVDVLCALDAEDSSTGKNEIALICEAIYIKVLAPNLIPRSQAARPIMRIFWNQDSTSGTAKLDADEVNPKCLGVFYRHVIYGAPVAAVPEQRYSLVGFCEASPHRHLESDGWVERRGSP